MKDSNLEIRLLDLHWIENIDDPTDLCAHGHIFVGIGDEVISDKNGLDVTVSATALYLMRTISKNYKKGDYASQLLPCCGYFVNADYNKNSVEICGCPSGIDWTNIHTDDSTVKHVSAGGKKATIGLDLYKEMVLDFADQVENFYNKSLPKAIPSDDFDKKGYLAFWNECRMLRNRWK
jgi:hypothetical protein